MQKWVASRNFGFSNRCTFLRRPGIGGYSGFVSFQCEHQSGLGFRRGSYRCVCADGFYFHRNFSSNANAYLHFYNGSELERLYYSYLLNQSTIYNRSFMCLPCAKGCAKGCIDDSPCLVEYDVMMRGIPLGLQSFCMTISMVLGIVIIRLRKSKVGVPCSRDLHSQYFPLLLHSEMPAPG